MPKDPERSLAMRRVFDDFNVIERLDDQSERVVLGNEERLPILLDERGDRIEGPPLEEGERVIITYPGNLKVEGSITIQERHGQRWWIGRITGAYRNLDTEAVQHAN
jgi:hypothetical protein